jgi:AbrB family looped-hinge helix DNA binding protein
MLGCKALNVMQDISYIVRWSKRMNVRISSKGQIVIPHPIRHKYSLGQGKELQIEEEDGVITLVVPTRLSDLCGTWEMDLRDVKKEIEESREQWRD